MTPRLVAAIALLLSATVLAIPKPDEPQGYAECAVGQTYCFSELQDDLKIPHTILAQTFCDQTQLWSCQTKCSDWPSCACGSECQAATYKCVGPRQYEYTGQCHMGTSDYCRLGVCFDPFRPGVPQEPDATPTRKGGGGGGATTSGNVVVVTQTDVTFATTVVMVTVTEDGMGGQVTGEPESEDGRSG